MAKRYGIRLEAQNGNKVKATLTDIGKAGSTAFSNMGVKAQKAIKSMGRFKTLGSVFGGLRSAIFNVKTALLGLVGVGGFSAAIKMSGNYASNLKDLSVTANASVESLQEINYAALQLGITQEQVVDGLKEMILRADEFVQTGGGPAAEAFERLGYTQTELAEKMKDTDRLFVEIISRMQDMDKAANIRISDELFGGSAGETFVRFVDAGTDSIIRLREEAREMGIVMSSEIVDKADQANDRLNALSEVLRTKLVVAIADNSEAIGEFADRMITELPHAIDKISRLAEVIGLLERKPNLESLNELRVELHKLNVEAAKGPSFMDRFTSNMTAAVDHKFPILQVGRWNKDNDTKRDEIKKKIAEQSAYLEKQEQEKLKQIYGINVDKSIAAARENIAEGSGLLDAFYKPEKKAKAKTKSTALKVAEREAKQRQKHIDQNKELIIGMERQIQLMSASSKELYVEEQAKKLNNEATSEQQEHMREMAALYHDNQQAAERYNASVQTLGGSLDGFLNSVLSGSLKTAEDWRDGILTLVQDVASEIARMQFGGSSGGGLGTVLASSILDGFGFGGSYASADNLDIQWSAPRRASGGPVYAGKVYSVNEAAEQEHFIPFVNGSVMPNSKISGGANEVNVSVHNYAGASVSVQQNQSANGVDLDLIIDRKISSAIRDETSLTARALGERKSPQAITR